MAMAIKLHSAAQIPSDISRKLESFTDVFKEQESWERLLKIPSLLQIVKELDEICLRECIFGYHYTRAEKESIEKHGLVALSGDERRRDFLERYGHLFTDEQRARIRKKWTHYFLPEMCKSRDSKIYFNFTLDALEGTGAEYLLEYYGGEVVNFPLCDDPELKEILKTIGQPMIVECVLNPAELATYYEYPWGKIWLSSYHVTLNPNACRCDQDGNQKISVRPDQIHSIQILQPPFRYRKMGS
jgi:hypothetical protein